MGLRIMKLLVEPRIAIKKSFKILMRYKLTYGLEKIKRLIEHVTSSKKTGNLLPAWVLLGPCKLNLEYLPERKIKPMQIRVEVCFCGLTGSDALLWCGQHHRIPTRDMILGFQVSGRILEMGELAHERTGYEIGEEVVVHNYPACGGLSETCLAHYKDVFRLMGRVTLEEAAAVMDDYFSALLAIGRRAHIETDERFLVNAKHSRSALAVIDLAVRVFGAKPIAICEDARRAKLCTGLGATVIREEDQEFLPGRLKEINGKERVRVIIETEGEPDFRNAIKCLEHDGMIALLDRARDRRKSCPMYYGVNCTVFAVGAEHYKIADTLVYRETMQHVLDYQSECVIRPCISAIFGLYHIQDAFDYYMSVPGGQVLIDVKNRNRTTLWKS